MLRVFSIHLESALRKYGLPFSALFLAAILAAPSSYAVDTKSPSDVSDAVAQARVLIDAKEYEAALEILETAIAENSNDADAYNLAGYAARKSENLGDAASYYANALEIDPNHKGALEYQGELYLDLKRPAKAKANLDRLRDVCGEACEEYLDLAEEISAFEASN